jgi:hypothetical protein
MTKKSLSKKTRKFKTIPIGTKVSWKYRSAIGHGKIHSVFKLGTNAASTKYYVKEFDHHPGEKGILKHYGRVLHKEKT